MTLVRINELLYKGLINGTPIACSGLNVYLMYLALTSKIRTKHSAKKRGMLRFVNQIIHRVTGASLLAYCALNGLNLYKQRPMTSLELYAFCGTLLLNSASTVLLLENLPYTNSRTHRMFALSVISNVCSATGFLGMWADVTHNETLLKFRYLLTAPILIGGLWSTVVSVLELIDVLYVAAYGKQSRNLSPIRRQQSNSMKTNRAGRLTRQSSALDYNPVNRIFLRAVGKMLQQTRRADSEEPMTSAEMNPYYTIGITLAGLAAGGIFLTAFYLRETGKLAYTIDNAPFVLRSAIGMSSYAWHAPFVGTLFMRGQTSFKQNVVLASALFLIDIVGCTSYSYWHRSGKFFIFPTRS